MTTIAPQKTHHEMLEEWQQEPEFKSTYDELETEYTQQRELLLARQHAGMAGSTSDTCQGKLNPLF